MMLFKRRGVTVMLVLVFMGVFGLAVSTLASYIFTQSNVSRAKLAREQAFSVAEAGLEYYRWFLEHTPGNLTNGTGASGPYEYTVTDPEGGELGTASISVTGNTVCNVLQSIDISSEGSADANPAFSRTLSARYAQPSVARFSHVLNANVWAGSDRNITGPYHSNGGIRMDGTNNSTVSSGVATWLCTSSFGCSPNQNRPGVFGGSPNSSLWEFPVPQVNFAGMLSDLPSLKSRAQSHGLYFASYSGGNDRRGYWLIFNSNRTVTVRRVTGTNYADSIHIDNMSTWVRDYHRITTYNTLGTYTIPANCGLIYVEDKVWVQGTISGKVTLVAADLVNAGYAPDMILQNNIGYTTPAGTDGFTAIAEHSVLYGYDVPTNMTVRGIYVAQTGYYGRNLYPCTYAPYDKRNSLLLHGSIVSTQRVGTQWGYTMSGCGSNWSGFNTRTDSYDRLLALDPPPFTPVTSADHRFILWREEQ